VGGVLRANIFRNDPEERCAYDGYDIGWRIGCTVNDPDLVHREAERIFKRMAGNPPWPALLFKGVTWLIAAWSPERGYHVFPERTTPDEKHEAVWAPFAIDSGRPR
jgi:hypothetical protein